MQNFLSAYLTLQQMNLSSYTAFSMRGPTQIAQHYLIGISSLKLHVEIETSKTEISSIGTGHTAAHQKYVVINSYLENLK